MAVLFWVLLLLSVTMASVEAGQHHHRKKRNLFQLGHQMLCEKEKPSDYLIYGCYCGLNGSGTPKDKADECCHAHDCCYGEAKQKFSQDCNPYFKSYTWNCVNNVAVCEDTSVKNCESAVCICDKTFVDCIRSNVYNKENNSRSGCASRMSTCPPTAISDW
ncbi:basic phospholipase A2 acanthin-1-like [Pholidichthys leucotaenia]